MIIKGRVSVASRIYKKQNTPEKIGSLYPIAETLNSAMQKTIVRILQEADQSSC